MGARGNLPGIYRVARGNLPGIYRVARTNLPGIYRVARANLPGIYRVARANFPGTPRNIFGFKKYPRPRGLRKNFEKLFPLRQITSG